jgi:hypothetical protein
VGEEEEGEEEGIEEVGIDGEMGIEEAIGEMTMAGTGEVRHQGDPDMRDRGK